MDTNGNINKLFVNYEIALLAKEKGFNEICLAWTLPNESEFLISYCDKYTIQTFDKKIQIPLYQQLVDWFMKQYNIFIMIYPRNKWCYVIYQVDSELTCDSGKHGESNTMIESYNSAFEEAFKLI